MSKVVCWDSGHGGSDPGAVSSAGQEKNLTLSIVQRASAKLSNRDVKQIFTRTGDNTISLGDRVNFANNNAATYLPSIHVNASGLGARGFESFVFNGPHGPETDRIRAILHKRIAAVFTKYGSPDRGMKSADFQVLRDTNMSAGLFEIGFIDSADAELLKSEAFLNDVAQAIADGLVEALALPLLAPVAPPAPIVDQEKEQLKAKVAELEKYKAEAGAGIAALNQTITLLQTKLSTTAADLAEWEDLGDKLKELLGV